MIIFLTILITFLIANNQVLSSGASYGLMLWYNNVLPLLLPFMLISGLLEKEIINSNKLSYIKSISTILFLGVFCGYPIGAKTNASFINANIISNKLGNILLPICNNVSPMFFLGFVINNILKNSISPILAYAVIYIPYIIFLLPELLLFNIKDKPIAKSTAKEISHKNKSIAEESIMQITMVGLYIMLCSILTEFIICSTWFSNQIKLLLVGLTEITRGITYINQSNALNAQIKTALILSFTSFGGISSIMQTKNVIQGSGLSLIHYICIKVLCAISTFYLYLLLV